MGESVDRLMGDASLGRHTDYIQHYLESGESHVIGRSRHVEGRHRDGQLVPLELSVAVMYVDEQPFFVGLIRPSPQ